jgi:SAM-dependent methyltransferase
MYKSNDELYREEHERWENNSSFYHTEPESPYYQQLHKSKIKTYGLNLFLDKVVVDIGAGNGYFVSQLHPLVPFSSLVIDYSLTMLKGDTVGNRTSLKVNGAAQSLPLCTGSVDVAILHGALHHFKAENIYGETVNEIDRILSPGGYVCIYDRNGSLSSRVTHKIILTMKRAIESITGTLASSSSNHEPDFNDDDLRTFLTKGYTIEKRKFVSTVPFFLLLVICNSIEYIVSRKAADVLRKITFPVGLFFERIACFKFFTIEQCLVMRKRKQ